MSGEKKFYKILNLREGEEIIRVIRRYPLTLFFKILLALILILAPFFFMFLLFSWGFWGVLLFLLVLGCGIVYALKIFVVWHYNASIVTNYRVIDFDQRGFFDKTVSGITYDKIQEVSYHQRGLWQSMFKYGSVQLQIANTSTKIKLRYVHHPAEVQELILGLQHAYKGSEESPAESPSNSKRIEKAWEDIKNFSDEELERLQKKIDDKIMAKDEAVKEIFSDEG
ncbi:MAG: PH domain-containing protein [Patescibacteria group bacterium]|nr:PH domain-containing protein [Patescibacteria group bacterium]MDD5490687.1 PH domain-containing protein [Patescibacteria group bacterium]